MSLPKWFTDLGPKVKDFFTDDDDTLSWTKIAAAAGLTVTAAKALAGSELGAKIGDFMGIGGGNPQPVGYQGKIPEYTGIRSVVGDTYDPLRRPGSGGQRYFSDMAFATPSEVQGQGLLSLANQQATASKALNRDNLARQLRPKPLILAKTRRTSRYRRR